MLEGSRARARWAMLAVAAVVVATVGTAGPSNAASSNGSRGKLTPASVQPKQDGATIAAQVANAKAAAGKDGRTAVVVRLKDPSLASYQGTVNGLKATTPQLTGADRLDVASADSKAYLAHLNKQLAGFGVRAKAASPTAKITHVYDVVLGGVAMTLPAADLAKVAKDPQVAAVYPDRAEQPLTDVTPKFIGATSVWDSLGGREKAGEDRIVGVIDTGIWPEHPSLSDPDPSGKRYPAARAATDGAPRACDFTSGANPGPGFRCNNKLIGAYTFLQSYAASYGFAPGEYTSARDDEGHGTHTASTAAGNSNVKASIFGVPRGTVSGIAPRAHVIAYRVCALKGCFTSDAAAAVQRAIVDGVDTINFSISGGADPYSDPVSLAFLDAYNAGIFVAASAGNSGPTANTTDHREPWVTTVAASTGPRSFVGKATLTSSDGATLTVTGTTVSPALTTAAPVVDAGTIAVPPGVDAALCGDQLPANAFTGKVVLCKRGGNGRVDKGYQVSRRGGVGMILYNQSPAVTDLETDNHFLPAVQVQVAEGAAVATFVAGHKDGVTATITGGVATAAKGDAMASFSSRGGDAQSLGVSKPDVTAPGVQILAGMTPTPADPGEGPAGQLFQAIAGTSMSSPHVAGAAALIKDLHPKWTPGQIRSALMTTANTKVVKEDGVTPADAFDDGSGRINLSVAKDPYFTISDTGASFVAKQSSLQNANYPSVYVPVLAGRTTLTRTVKSVSSVTRSYSVSVTSPSDLKVSVSPSSFSLKAGASRTLTFTIDGKDTPLDATRFATVTLKSGSRSFHVPVTAVRGQGPLAVTQTCAPGPVPVGAQTTCSLTMTNTSTSPSTVTVTDKVPSRLAVVPGTVSGATASGNTVVGSTTLPGRQAPKVDAAYVTPAFGYLPLSGFGVAQVSGVGDETITNFTVPAFTVAGVSYTRIGLVSNGYVVLGGGSQPDVNYRNSDLPNAAPPNNVIAPFWSDLNPGTGGAVRIGTLTDGADTWLVVDYDAVREYSSAARRHSFEIWLGLDADAHPGEDVAVDYGPNTGDGDGGAATVGVENPDGSQGRALYFNGTGTLPAAGEEWKLTGTPGVTSSATVTYKAKGVTVGTYVNYANVAASVMPNDVAVARFAGSVVAAP